MRKLGTNEYQCAKCGDVFEKGWSDEASKIEAYEVFGKPVDEWKSEPVLVCDDCYQEMLPSEHLEEVKRVKSII